MQKISIIIPAHNEQRYIPKCLDSIRNAESQANIPVEIIVVLNRCTDSTEDVAKRYGAVTVQQDEKSLAKIRNTGVRSSTGDVILTIDADSWMTPKTGNRVKSMFDPCC